MAGGRPTDFKEDYIRQAYVACSEGAFTDRKLGKLFDVSEVTINAWKKKHPEFLKSLKRGKDEFDCVTAEKCLLKRVTGYRYTEKTKEPDKHGKMVVTKTVTRHIPPDVKACDTWLCNRNPQRWRKLKHVELTGEGGSKLIDNVNVNLVKPKK